MFARDLESQLGLRVAFDPSDSERGRDVLSGAGAALLSTGQKWMWNSPELRSEYTFMHPFGATKFGPTGPFAKMMDKLGVGRRILPEPIMGFGPRYFLESFPGVSAKKALAKSRGMAAHMNGQIAEWHGDADDTQRFGGTAITNQKFSGEDGVLLREVDAVRVPSFFYRLFIENAFYNRDFKRVLKLGGTDAEEQLKAYAETKVIPTWLAKWHEISGRVSKDGQTTWIDAEGVAKIKSTGYAGGIARRWGEAGFVSDVGMTGWRAYQSYAQSNPFAADSELRHFAARNSMGILGGAAAGFVWGFLGGSPTGPGAIATGLIGSIIGAFAGDAAADAYDQRKIKNITGTDGVLYTRKNDQWFSRTAVPDVGPDSYADHGVKWKTIYTPAPLDQVPFLDFQSRGMDTKLKLGRPLVLDTENVTLDGKDWTRLPGDDWYRNLNAREGGGTEFADDEKRAKLNEMAAQRQQWNDNYREMIGLDYLWKHYQKGWNKIGPLPEAVTDVLHLPSETHLIDPETGIAWDQGEDGRLRRTETEFVQDMPVPYELFADDAVTKRVKRVQQEVQAQNAAHAHYLETHTVSYGHPGIAAEGPYSPNSIDDWGGLWAAPATRRGRGDLATRSVLMDPALLAPSPIPPFDIAPPPPRRVTTVNLHMDGVKIDTQTFEHD